VCVCVCVYYFKRPDLGGSVLRSKLLRFIRNKITFLKRRNKCWSSYEDLLQAAACKALS
jgi:hypothetical protein